MRPVRAAANPLRTIRRHCMRKFKTESKKLLDLMINSIYTNKEIFLSLIHI